MNEMLGSGGLNEILGFIEGYWSRAHVYFTAEVCSNILDLLAFLLVTPEFLPPERRLHIARMVGHVGLLLTRFLTSAACVFVYKIMAFPLITAMSVLSTLILMGIVESIMGLMPHALALIMKACIIWVLIMTIFQVMLECLRHALIYRLTSGLRQGKLKQNRSGCIIAICSFILTSAIIALMPHAMRLVIEASVILLIIAFTLLVCLRHQLREPGLTQGKLESDDFSILGERYQFITFFCGFILAFAISIQDKLHIKLPAWAELTPESVVGIFLVSFFFTMAYGFLCIVSSLLTNPNKDMSFWIGVGFFVVARAVSIWHSASEVWIGAVAH